MVLEMTYSQLERAINPTHDIKLFAGRSNPALAQEIADYLGTTVGPMVIKNFADGEIYVQVKESIRGDDVFIPGGNFTLLEGECAPYSCTYRYFRSGYCICWK